MTQESPTIERPGASDWETVESPTAEFAADAPTVETPTIESPAASRRDDVVEDRGDSAALGTADRRATRVHSASTDFTAEIDLDDLGLDVKDIEGLPSDLGDLPGRVGETDTREQPALRDDDSLLSATGVTKVLHGDDADDTEQSLRSSRIKTRP